jgi:hypothetical protein
MTNAHSGHPNVMRQTVLRHSQFFQQFLEVGPWMDRGNTCFFGHDASSMIIHNFHLLRMPISPYEADAPLMSIMMQRGDGALEEIGELTR